jgi:flavin reductase (DIM6/NTAB) family NADH-FMN oxidoreductase RutF
MLGGQGEVRSKLAGLPRAVAIITMLQGDRCLGLAASSVSELSIAPAALALSVSASAAPHGLLSGGSALGVNILSRSQEYIARSCPHSLTTSFWLPDGQWSSFDGTPILPDAQASFACISRNHIAFGGHVVIVAEVAKAAVDSYGEPLIFYDQRYGSFEANFRQIM